MTPLEMDKGRLNTDKDRIIANVETNIRLGLPQVKPYPPQARPALICGGGPSLEHEFEDLRDRWWKGDALIPVNGAYSYLIDKNLRPSAAVLVDARPFNARFFEYDVPGCRYLIASQCDPTVFEMLEGRDVSIFHMATHTEEEEEILSGYYGDGKYVVAACGSTVTLNALSVTRILGFQFAHVYGFDSCFMDGRDHAYDQPENSRDRQINVHCAGRDFKCAPWMLKQAEDFMDMVHHQGEMFNLNVHGDGLIAHIMQTGANLTDLKKED
jgi:hypothetical protein